MSLNNEIFTLEVGTERYPAQLSRTLGKHAPKKLYCIGNYSILLNPSVGFCGSRKASEKGLKTADDCATQAAENQVVVVSGNAAGIDFHAHYNALEKGGSTILVLPEGISHFRIKRDFFGVWDWERVLVISQFEPSTPWRSYHAMARNKVILGLSNAMVVIEAGTSGGTLDAGKSTLNANLPLFVAQYEYDGNAAGNRVLIEMGGIPLNRLRSTNRANMKKVWETIADPEQARPQASLI